MDDVDLRSRIPLVVNALVRRGAPFADAEDAVQTALERALQAWAEERPRDPTAWLVTAAWRAYLDQVRSEAARRQREERLAKEPASQDATEGDDTLWLYFLCAHPSLTPASAIALTLRAVGGLTTGQIAGAYQVPEATMGQRISRAKQRVSNVPLGQLGPVATVLRVLYLLFNEGYSGEIDLAAEAIRLTRQLTHLLDDPEAHGLLALMLLHHARRGARTTASGRLIPLTQQDRTRWDPRLIGEGVAILQEALAHHERGEYQVQAAIAALHADAPSVAETDWPQILQWYDELVTLTGSDVVRLNRAVALGEARGPRAGLEALSMIPESVPRHAAASAHLHARAGNSALAAATYAEAARRATSEAERIYLEGQAARMRRQG